MFRCLGWAQTRLLCNIQRRNEICDSLERLVDKRRPLLGFHVFHVSSPYDVPISFMRMNLNVALSSRRVAAILL